MVRAQRLRERRPCVDPKSHPSSSRQYKSQEVQTGRKSSCSAFYEPRENPRTGTAFLERRENSRRRPTFWCEDSSRVSCSLFPWLGWVMGVGVCEGVVGVGVLTAVGVDWAGLSSSTLTLSPAEAERMVLDD